ncbi:MAG: HEAT repeat domain-containing protein [Deltaproteobacteria bacterium]|nr:HEAT repeat domain-containing protein [Deltaproteobacteria bacterium]
MTERQQEEQHLDLSQVAITAAIAPTGRLEPIKGLWAKLLAAASAAATTGLVRTVLVAADQPDVPVELEHESSPLRLIRAATLREALDKLYEEHGPRQAVRHYEHQQCLTLDLLGRLVPFAEHYQPLPLLREVKRDRLRRTGKAFGHDPKNLHALNARLGVDLLRWEEELHGESIAYEQLRLDQLFEDFRAFAKRTSVAIPRFLVLGPPGSGKTTLVQYLSLQAASGRLRMAGRGLLPVRVRLREWESFVAARAGGAQHLPAYLVQHYSHLVVVPSASQWRRWLQSGEVLLLLDGLDEIQGDSSFLALLTTTLATFATGPVVMTCRTVSFEQHRTVCPDFPLFTLAGLDQAQRDAYIRAFPAEYPTSYEPDDIIGRLRHSPQLAALAANPLLLSILCYTADNLTPTLLPTTRGELYGQAVEKLLQFRAQRVATSYPGPPPAPHEKLAILQRAALYLFAADNRQLSFSGQALTQALKLALSEEGYGDAAAVWANALFTDLQHNSGLLRGHAKQGFFFFHLTLQEALAAAALARSVNDGGWHTALTVSGKRLPIAALIDKKSWDPRWQEVTVLLAGQLADPLPLLSSFVDKKRDDFFHSRLALAAQCLTEVRKVRVDLRSTLSSLVDHVTDEAFSTWLSHETRGVSAAVPHLTRALSALASLNGQIEKTPFLRWLEGHLHAGDVDRRAGLVEACGHMGERLAQEPEVLAALATALQDLDVVVRFKAAEALRRVGSVALYQPDVRAALLHTAKFDPEWFVRMSARRALSNASTASSAPPSELAEVSAFLQTNPLPTPTPRDTEQDIPQSGSALQLSLDTLETLLKTLHATDAGVRIKTATTMKQWGVAILQSSDLLPALTEVALHDPDSGVRAQAVDTLGHLKALDARHPRLPFLLTVALRDRDAGVRAQAARALGQGELPEHARQDTLAALFEAWEDDDSEVRFAVAETFQQLSARGLRIFRRWWGKREGKTVEELAAL